MSNDKPLTVKRFLKLASGKVSAQGFLAQHKAFLLSGELAPMTTPILSKVDLGELMPTPALEAISQAVLSHYLACQVRIAEDKIAASQEREESSVKNWMVTIFDSRGVIQTRVNDKGETVDLCESFDLCQRASEWGDRRLFEGGSDWTAVVEHVTLAVRTVTERGDAIARIMKQPKACASKKVGSRDNKLSWSAKCVQSRASFSRG
jgi:hypothetical protein